MQFLFVNDPAYSWIKKHEPEAHFPDAPFVKRRLGTDGPEDDDDEHRRSRPRYAQME